MCINLAFHNEFYFDSLKIQIRYPKAVKQMKITSRVNPVNTLVVKLGHFRYSTRTEKCHFMYNKSLNHTPLSGPWKSLVYTVLLNLTCLKENLWKALRTFTFDFSLRTSQAASVPKYFLRNYWHVTNIISNTWSGIIFRKIANKKRTSFKDSIFACVWANKFYREFYDCKISVFSKFHNGTLI